jgi:hypothetical protein
MKNLKVGDRVFVPESSNPFWTGIGKINHIFSYGCISLDMETGTMAGKRGAFRASAVQEVPATKIISAPGMRVVSLKRSTQKTGLKVYGKVQGESGKEYNVAYIRRSNFRGWICSCENFFFTMFKKNRNCKHIKFVRGQVGRYAATVKN